MAGIANGSAITVTGGDYRIDAGAFTNVAGTINDGQSVTLRQTAAATCGLTTTTTVTIAGVARDFNVSTIPCDTTPNPITDFSGQGNVPINSVRVSNSQTISGINGPTPVSVTGGEYSIGCTATFTATAGTILNNQTVCVRQTSAASADTATTTTLTVGPLTAMFRVITAVASGTTITPLVVAGVGGVNTGVRSDGVVFEWSGNGAPLQRGDISGVRRLSMGMYHTLALRADGVVWAWSVNLPTT